MEEPRGADTASSAVVKEASISVTQQCETMEFLDTLKKSQEKGPLGTAKGVSRCCLPMAVFLNCHTGCAQHMSGVLLTEAAGRAVSRDSAKVIFLAHK